ncbi:MAG: 50S ribosomal protein L3 [Campylobacterales bacterium]|nr:50S ribosomal protein L3 [Campylobacterales bacterium]
MEFIVEKIGMSRTVTVPATAVTLVRVVETKVCEVKDGIAVVAYNDGKKFNKAVEGQQKKYNLSKEFNRFATLNVANSEAGDIDTSALTEGVVVKSTFKTKGRGFTGAVKRHGFAGGRASHGHRMGKRTGSIGNCEWPGRVQPGRKMPGQYGNTNVTHKNHIVSFDAETGILVLKGSVAGSNGTLGKVRIV